MTELTQARLKEVLKYDPETGYFTRLVKPSNRVKIGDIAGATNSTGYIQIRIDNKIYKAHRLAFLYMDGKFPEKVLQVDHENQKKDDNRWVNLRLVTSQENNKNKPLRKDNKVGCSGVFWNKSKEKWAAQIRVDGKNKHLGYFDNIDDAIAARKAAEIKFDFHKNHGTLS